MKMILGSRGSKLALVQSRLIAERLRGAGGGVEIRQISTRGDQRRDLAFEQIGAPGVFVRELETALIAAGVDLVVHSYKDLPSASPAGLTVAAVPGRRDAADRLLALPAAIDSASTSVLPLVTGAKVGTASARRGALLSDLRPDLEVAHLRGNVPTRLKKLRAGEYDAILLAAAGLERLEELTHDLVDMRLDPALFIPAPSQGALAVQVRVPENDRDQEIFNRVAALDEALTRRVVSAERHLQALIEGGCQTAFGAWCHDQPDGRLRLYAALDGPGGLRRATGEGEDPLALAESLWPPLRDDYELVDDLEGVLNG